MEEFVDRRIDGRVDDRGGIEDSGTAIAHHRLAQVAKRAAPGQMRRRVRYSPTPVEVEQFLSGANGCHCVGALVDQLRSKTKIERISQQAREARLCVAKKASEQRALLRNLLDLSVRQVPSTGRKR